MNGLPLPLAFSFAEWTCRECKRVIHWVDAVALNENDEPATGNDKLLRFVHAECVL